MYINGIATQTGALSDDSGTVPTTLVQNYQSYMVGNIHDYGGASNSAFQGVMDDVRIYNSVLTDAEILAIWRCGANTKPYLINYNQLAVKTLFTTAGSSDYSLYTLPFIWAVPFELQAPSVSITHSDVTWVTLISQQAPWVVKVLPPAGTTDGTYNVIFTGVNQYGEGLNTTLIVRIITVETPDASSTFDCCWWNTDQGSLMIVIIAFPFRFRCLAAVLVPHALIVCLFCFDRT
jgi:hypothetical protein